MKRDFLIIVVGLALLTLVWIGWAQFQALHGVPDERGEDVFCTADVQQCEDGSYVGRIAPDCRFAECPEN